MDIVLGVSLTPTTVRMVLVEGEKGDGATVDHDAFEVSGSGGSATSSAAEQVVEAVLGTQESAEAGGHHLKSIGVTWTDHAEASALRDALAARGVNDVMLVSELHAAGALAQAAGRAVGYSSTALLFLNRDTATLSVVRVADGSVVKVLSRSLHSTDAMAVLGDMAAAVAGQDASPEGMFVVGSGVDVASVKEHLADLVDIPVSAPEESGLALARGAALASASAPTFEASTVGLAYSLDPDGPTAGAVLASADTQLAPASLPNYVDGLEADLPDDLSGLDETPPAEEGRKPFLLVGSAMASIFVVGVVALAISLAVSIRPTADERPAPARAAVAPSAQAPAPKPVPEALPVQPAPAPPPAVAETIKAPIPVVQQAPQQAPRQVYVERAPAPQAPAPAPVPVAPPPPAPIAPPVVPPVWTPPVVLPPPVIVLPRPQWPVWRPPWEQKPRQTQQPQYPDYDDDDYPSYPGYPQQPQQPQPQQPKPQQPQQPQWPWPTGGNGSGGGNSESSRGDSGPRGDSGRGESRGGGQGGQGGQGGNCFLIFCN
ncbi:MAG: DUF7159 family protein [Mycobacterium sp.]